MRSTLRYPRKDRHPAISTFHDPVESSNARQAEMRADDHCIICEGAFGEHLARDASCLRFSISDVRGICVL